MSWIKWDDCEIRRSLSPGDTGAYKASLFGADVVLWRNAQSDESTRHLKTIRHPRLLQFVGEVTAGANSYSITEFIPRSVADVNLKKTILSFRQRLQMAADAAAGLAFLHACGIVHANLTCHHVLVDDAGRAKVSKSIPLVSTKWRAPELKTSDATPTVKTDVFSFGVILYEIMTGRLLTKAESSQKPVPLGSGAAFNFPPHSLNPELSKLVSECTQADPMLRPSSLALVHKLKSIAMQSRKTKRVGRGAAVDALMLPNFADSSSGEDTASLPFAQIVPNATNAGGQSLSGPLRRRLSLPLSRSIARRKSLELQTSQVPISVTSSVPLISPEPLTTQSQPARDRTTGNLPTSRNEIQLHNMKTFNSSNRLRKKVLLRDDSSSIGSAYDADSTTESEDPQFLLSVFSSNKSGLLPRTESESASADLDSTSYETPPQSYQSPGGLQQMAKGAATFRVNDFELYANSDEEHSSNSNRQNTPPDFPKSGRLGLVLSDDPSRQRGVANHSSGADAESSASSPKSSPATGEVSSSATSTGKEVTPPITPSKEKERDKENKEGVKEKEKEPKVEKPQEREIKAERSSSSEIDLTSDNVSRRRAFSSPAKPLLRKSSKIDLKLPRNDEDVRGDSSYPPIKEKKGSFGSLTQLFAKKRSSTPRDTKDSARDSSKETKVDIKDGKDGLHKSTPGTPTSNPPLSSSSMPSSMSSSTLPTLPATLSQSTPPPNPIPQLIPQSSHAPKSAIPEAVYLRPRKRSLSDVPLVLRQQQPTLEESPLNSSTENDTAPTPSTPSPSESTAPNTPTSPEHANGEGGGTGSDDVKASKRNSLPRAVKQLWNKGSHHGKKSKDKDKQEKK